MSTSIRSSSLRTLFSPAPLVALLSLAGWGGSALAAPTCQPPANLVANPGFEAGTWAPGARPDGWSFDSFSTLAAGTWDNTTAHSGRYSVRIDAVSPDDALWRQTAAVPVNVPLYLGGWIRSQNVQRAADQVSSPGASISSLGRWDQTAPTFGTTPWHRVGMTFITDTSPLIPAPRLGFWGGLTTGTAWYDDLTLVPRQPQLPHPGWKVLVLVYDQTDAVITDSAGVQHHVRSSSTPAELARVTEQARRFVEQDIATLSSGNMVPTLVLRHARRPLGTLTPFTPNQWWPAWGDTTDEVRGDFDSVIVIWDSRVRDVTSGAPMQLGSAVTLERGLMPIYNTFDLATAGLDGSRFHFRQQWGAAAQAHYQTLQVQPQPAVNLNPGASQYVNCQTGRYYTWLTETAAQPIPNSIGNLDSGFLHDFYSGQVARAEAPTVCLGLGSKVWAWGGPVTHSGSEPVYTTPQRLRAIDDQLGGLQTAGLLTPRAAQQLEALLHADGRGHGQPPVPVQLGNFSRAVQQLIQQKQVLPQAGQLLIDAAGEAAACTSDPRAPRH